MSPAEIILASVGGTAALVTVLGFLTRSIVVHLLSKDIEKFKIELEAERDIEVQRLSYQLQTLAEERQIRFERLHRRRDEVIANLYSKIVAFHRELEAYLDFAVLLGRDRSEPSKQKLWAAVDGLKEYAEINRIYFREGLAAHLDALIEAADNPTSMLMAVLDAENASGDGPDVMEAWRAAHETLTKEGQAVRREIENEFRELLGVSDGEPRDT